MKKQKLLAAFCGAVLLGGWLAGCDNAAKYEMPITTNSPEAKKLFMKGLELYENLREEEARDYFSRALEKDMDFALCHFYLADIATSAIEYQTHLKMAVALAKNVSEGERLLIESLRALAENNPERAIELRKRLVELYPRDKRAHRFLGYLYRERDDRKAIEEFLKAIEIDRNYAPAYNNLGYAYRRLGEYEKAVAAFKKYLRLLPEEPNPYDSIADLYTKMGRFEEAIQYYKKAVKLSKAFAFSQRKIGENYIFMDRYEDARNAIREALELEASPSGRVNTYLMYAASFLYESKIDDALKAAEKALQFAKASNLPEWQAETSLFRARLYIEKGELDKAGEEIKRAEAIFSDYELPARTTEKIAERIMCIKASLFARQKQFDQAFEVAEQLKEKIALSKDFKEMEKYHRVMGFLYYQKGHPATAIAHFRQASERDPFVLYYWALCEVQLQNPDKARELMEKVANWNEHSLDYAFLRNPARHWLKEVLLSQRME